MKESSSFPSLDQIMWTNYLVHEQFHCSSLFCEEFFANIKATAPGIISDFKAISLRKSQKSEHGTKPNFLRAFRRPLKGSSECEFLARRNNVKQDNVTLNRALKSSVERISTKSKQNTRNSEVRST
jgi:hypothetical protein